MASFLGGEPHFLSSGFVVREGEPEPQFLSGLELVEPNRWFGGHGGVDPNLFTLYKDQGFKSALKIQTTN